MTVKPTALFPLGRVVTTPGAREVLQWDIDPSVTLNLLRRHSRGDWGCVDPLDKRANDAAVREGQRLLSAYAIDPKKPCHGHGENCLWIITEADRSVTTFLLPSEY